MPANLNNVTTTDDYAPIATVEYMGTVGIALAVANAAVYAEFDESEDGRGVWSGETFYPPTMGWLPRKCSGIRFRSALAGKPAQVSCQLYNQDESEGTGALSPFTQQVSATGAVSNPTGNVIAGTVNADGSQASGTGWTSTRTGVGAYTISFSAPLLNLPNIAFGDAGGNAIPAWVTRDVSGFTVLVHSRGGGSPIDSPFSFIASS